MQLSRAVLRCAYAHCGAAVGRPGSLLQAGPLVSRHCPVSNTKPTQLTPQWELDRALSASGHETEFMNTAALVFVLHPGRTAVPVVAGGSPGRPERHAARKTARRGSI